MVVGGFPMQPLSVQQNELHMNTRALRRRVANQNCKDSVCRCFTISQREQCFVRICLLDSILPLSVNVLSLFPTVELSLALLTLTLLTLASLLFRLCRLSPKYAHSFGYTS